MKEIELNNFRIETFHNECSQLRYDNRLIRITLSIFNLLDYLPDFHLINFDLNSFLRDRYSIL